MPRIFLVRNSRYPLSARHARHTAQIARDKEQPLNVIFHFNFYLSSLASWSDKAILPPCRQIPWLRFPRCWEPNVDFRKIPEMTFWLSFSIFISILILSDVCENRKSFEFYVFIDLFVIYLLFYYFLLFNYRSRFITFML